MTMQPAISTALAKFEILRKLMGIFPGKWLGNRNSNEKHLMPYKKATFLQTGIRRANAALH
jgi:hypothetical protein